MFDQGTLLPPSAMQVEHALEQVMAERLGTIERVIPSLWNPNTCPEYLLPWLAWGFSAEAWEHLWAEETKRNVTREQISIHRLKGTRGAVEQALLAIGFRLQISEWFEHGGAPHTFRVDAYHTDVTRAGFQVDAAFLNQIRLYIQNIKPVRSHFDVRIGLTQNGIINLRSGMRIKRRSSATHTLQIAPHITASTIGLWSRTKVQHKSVANHTTLVRPIKARATGLPAISTGIRLRTLSSATHTTLLPVIRAMAISAVPIGTGLRARQISRHTIQMKERSA